MSESVLIIGLSAAGAVDKPVISNLVLTIMPRKDFSLEVDGIIDDQYLFTNSRIIFTNIGELPHDTQSYTDQRMKHCSHESRGQNWTLTSRRN